jgi:hypothetical protein
MILLGQRVTGRLFRRPPFLNAAELLPLLEI